MPPTGLRDADLRGAPHPAIAVRRFLEFADDAVLVAHNARFDLSFLDRETERLTGARLAGPVVDTVGLARRLLSGRTPRAGLASLAQFFGTAAQPCHRALPDAQATAEILLQLIGLAQERGALTVADLVDLAAPRVRKVYAKRSLAFGAPTVPGVYLFRDAHDQVLYVGRARDLRARLRDLSDCRRFEAAARLRDRLSALDDVIRTVRRLERLRRTRCCLIVPAAEPGFARGIFVAGGRITDVRTLASRLEVEAGLAASDLVAQSHMQAEDADELLLIGTFLRRPPPELRVAALDAEEILRLAAALPQALVAPARRPGRARAA